MQQAINLNCPGCGAPVSTSQKQCVFCSRPIVITSFRTTQTLSPLELNKYANAYRKELANNPDNKELNMSIAFCYLKLKLYDKALPTFEKAIEDNFDNSETFFYTAVCLLKGQKAFVAPRANIDKIEEYINVALMIEPKGIYHFFQAYIKYDYFHRKYLNTTPTWEEAFQTATATGVSLTEIEQLFTLIGVEVPEKLLDS
jgi:tetratricopeptide (TPR) repeat protein